MGARGFLCLVFAAIAPSILVAQEAAPPWKAFPVAKIQILDRPGENNADAPPLGGASNSGFQVVYRIRGKNILSMNGVVLESLVGPDGKDRAADWNKENQQKTPQPVPVIVQERNPVTQFMVSIPDGEFGKLDLYKFKGHAKVLVGVETAKVTAEVWSNGTEVKTEPGFTLKMEVPGKGAQVVQPGLAGLLNPDFLAQGLLERVGGPPVSILIVGGPFANVRSIREKGRKVMGMGQAGPDDKEMRLFVPLVEEGKRTFVIEYWKETREIKVPFQL